MKIYWNLGDGFQKEGSLGVAYKWEEAATYNVSATVIDSLNALTTESVDIEIKNVIPEAKFKYSVDTPSSLGFNLDVPNEEPVGWRTYEGGRYMPSDFFDEHNLNHEVLCETPKVVEWMEGRYKVAEFSGTAENSCSYI